MNNLIFQPYIGGAGPSKEIIENNDLYLLQELKKVLIECEYGFDKQWSKEMFGSDEDFWFKTINVKINKKIVFHISYDRWGFVSEEIDEIDQAGIDFTIDKIVDEWSKIVGKNNLSNC